MGIPAPGIFDDLRMSSPGGVAFAAKAESGPSLNATPLLPLLGAAIAMTAAEVVIHGLEHRTLGREDESRDGHAFSTLRRDLMGWNFVKPAAPRHAAGTHLGRASEKTARSAGGRAAPSTVSSAAHLPRIGQGRP